MTEAAPFAILFVDDEERVLCGLRRQLRAHRSAWTPRFATSGEEALRELERSPADVVVADVQMPRMSGIELLRIVNQRWPSTVRIVLSGQTSHVEILRGIGSVHQFVQKPCDPIELIQTIERSRELARLLAQEELRAVAAGIHSLPVVSETFAELLEVLEDDSSSLDQIARIVERDVGLATKVLQLVNSAFFGLPRHIDRVHDAVVLVGVSHLRAVALGARTFDALESSTPESAAIKALWDKSFEIARAAEQIASEHNLGETAISRARLAGMLSLIGRALLVRTRPERFAEVRAKAARERLLLCDAETAVFGASQHLIGGYALGVWGFDADIVDAVTFQAAPELVELSDVTHPLASLHMARCVSTATNLADRFEPCPAIRALFTKAGAKPGERQAAA